MGDSMPETLGERLDAVERHASNAAFLLLVHDNTTVRRFTYRESLSRARR
jgi:hypothetical protein